MQKLRAKLKLERKYMTSSCESRPLYMCLFAQQFRYSIGAGSRERWGWRSKGTQKSLMLRALIGGLCIIYIYEVKLYREQGSHMVLTLNHFIEVLEWIHLTRRISQLREILFGFLFQAKHLAFAFDLINYDNSGRTDVIGLKIDKS